DNARAGRQAERSLFPTLLRAGPTESRGLEFVADDQFALAVIIQVTEPHPAVAAIDCSQYRLAGELQAAQETVRRKPLRSIKQIGRAVGISGRVGPARIILMRRKHCDLLGRADDSEPDPCFDRRS